ncbi:hypothetical protein HQ560_09575, partial [bacterium]|nr:hypothetical protein [bacterium]
MTHSRRALPFLVALGLLLAAGAADAARLLNVTFEQDGKVVLQTYYDDGGRADGPTV